MQENLHEDIGLRNSSTASSSTSSSSRKRKAREGQHRDGDEFKGDLGVLMEITEEERQRALAIRQAALQEHYNSTEKVDKDEDDYLPHIRDVVQRHCISDMELVQYALIERHDIAKAHVRMRKMDLFRRNYQIQDTVDHGVACIDAFMRQQPGFSINLDQCSRHKHYVHVVDFAKFNPRKVHLESDWKVFMSGLYYYVLALNPNLAAVRNGVLGIVECEGMGWHNFCIEFERRMWHEHPSAYPFRFHELSWVRTPLVGNVFFSLLRPIMPPEIQKVVHLGVKFDESFEGRLDTLFLQPDAETANLRQLKTAKAFLEEHFHNRQHFQLQV